MHEAPLNWKNQFLMVDSVLSGQIKNDSTLYDWISK